LVFNQWWTNITGSSDDLGKYLVRAFKGDYDITVTYKGQKCVEPSTLNSDRLVTVSLPFSVAFAGDYNNDGIVDAADYVVWRDHLGGSSLPNEPVSYGDVDQAEYHQW